MKRCLLWGVLAILVGAVPGSAKIYQIGLVMSMKGDRDLNDQVMTEVSAAFFESKRFEVIERERLDKIFTERDLQDFIKGSPGDLSTLEGVDLLGLVTFTKEHSSTPTYALEEGSTWKYFIDVRLTDVTTGKVAGTISSRRDTLTVPSTPHLAARNLLQNIREKYPPEGYIIDISGETVLVDLGEEVGLKKGDVLEIIREGNVIFHPVTHKPMPAQEIIVGTLKVTDPANQMSTCKLKSSEGQQVAVADRVRLKAKDQTVTKFINKIPLLKRLKKQKI